MSETQQAPESEETPDQPEAPEAPETDQPDGEQAEDSFESFDLGGVPDDADKQWFEERVKAFQSDYTRKTQAAAEARKQALGIIEAARDPNHPSHSEVMDYLGLEVADDDNEDEDDLEDNPQAALEQRLAALEAERQQANETAQQAARREAYENEVVTRLDSLKLKHGIDEFGEEELALLVNTAAGIPDDEGLPNVDKAYDLLTEAYGKRQKAYLDGKKSAPRPAGNGVPATRGLDITDRDARLEAAMAAAERARAE